MKTWAANKWDLLKDNFLFVPLAMCAIAVVTCLTLSYVDTQITLPQSGLLSLLRSGNAEGVRSLLTALVGSLMTALCIVFSITVVALTLAASQLGPRLLRNFMRDRSNQVILGVFVATFLYCLLTLRLVGQATSPEQLPHLTVVGGFALACAALAVLVYFIHHVALSIQSPQVITSVARELMDLIDRSFPEPGDEQPEKPDIPDDVSSDFRQVTADWDGYIQAIDEQGLIRIAEECDVILKILCRPGHFVAKGEEVAQVYSAEEQEEARDHAVQAIRGSFAWTHDRSDIAARYTVSREAVRRTVIQGSRRNAIQDLEFVMMQLVEIATRALSPGINDPFTAMTCIDRLGAAMCEIARRPMPPTSRFDDDGNLRLILDQTDFQGLCRAAFCQIRQHAHDNAAVSIRLLEALHRIAKQTRTDEQRQAVWQHAQMVNRAGQKLPEPLDQENVADRFDAIREELADFLQTSEQLGNAD
ncbi:MAG: DUF2254 domain-containing protein [Candidatus Brocadiia bacterium]